MSLLVDGELMLYGTVGNVHYGDYFTPREVTLALAELGRESDIVVRINSGGGIALDGTAIYNALKTHDGKVTIYVDGDALSAASIIAMAGDEIIMREGSMMMIHNPIGFTYGDIRAHEQEAKVLGKIGEQMAGIYAKKTGVKTELVSGLMDDETWFSPSEAVAQGFATGEQEEPGLAATAFDYRMYLKSPDRLTAMATAMATERNWPAPKVHTLHKENTPMPQAKTKQSPTPEQVEQLTPQAPQASEAAADERLRMQTIMTSEAAKGREALAQHLAFSTEMSADSVIAALEVSPKAEEKPQHDYDSVSASGDMVAGLEVANAPQDNQAAPMKTINANEIYTKRAAARRS